MSARQNDRLWPSAVTGFFLPREFHCGGTVQIHKEDINIVYAVRILRVQNGGRERRSHASSAATPQACDEMYISLPIEALAPPPTTAFVWAKT